jgi:hypothetical protein
VEVWLLPIIFSFSVYLLRCQCLRLYTVYGRILDDLETCRKQSFCKKGTNRQLPGGNGEHHVIFQAVFGVAAEICVCRIPNGSPEISSTPTCFLFHTYLISPLAILGFTHYDLPTPSGAKVNSGWSLSSIPICFNSRHRDNFTFTFNCLPNTFTAISSVSSPR